MLLRLILIFTILPLIELWLLMWISTQTGVILTISLVIITGVIGAALARRQGWRVWSEIQAQLARGETPAGILLDGLMILIAGALLITPGVLTDIIGFALLIPRFRAFIKRRLTDWFKKRTVVHVQTFHARTHDESRNQTDDNIIDAEFTRMPDREHSNGEP